MLLAVHAGARDVRPALGRRDRVRVFALEQTFGAEVCTATRTAVCGYRSGRSTESRLDYGNDRRVSDRTVRSSTSARRSSSLLDAPSLIVRCDLDHELAPGGWGDPAGRQHRGRLGNRGSGDSAGSRRYGQHECAGGMGEVGRRRRMSGHDCGDCRWSRRRVEAGGSSAALHGRGEVPAAGEWG